MARFCSILFFLINLPGIAAAQDEFTVKAAFLLKFPAFIEWSKSGKVLDSKVFKIGIFNNPAFANIAKSILKNKEINEQVVQVDYLPKIEVQEKFNVIYFSHNPGGNSINSEKYNGVLTIGEGERFIDDGGILAFTIEDSKIRFFISNSNAIKAGLKISSKLLQLARKVY
ncbi:MAG: YfiR family protein [Candidatus Riflebacteria bacterium]|nr:YfiR family protein [Candidatus Riflebacteria bacterium]